MAMVRDELLAKEITREELKALVDEWVANGGKIKQCLPADAYSFNLSATAGYQQTSDGLLRVRKSLRGWLVKDRPRKVSKAPLKIVK